MIKKISTRWYLIPSLRGPNLTTAPAIHSLPLAGSCMYCWSSDDKNGRGEMEKSDTCVTWTWLGHRPYSVDWKMAVVRCPHSASCMTSTNPDSDSSSESWVDSGLRSWKGAYLIALDVRKTLIVPVSQRSEELRLYNLVQNLTISYPGLKALSSNSFPGWTVCFLCVMIGVSERSR